jgi:hypothetical protein
MLRIAAAALLAFSVTVSAQAQPVQPPAAVAAKPAVKKPTPPKGVSASRPATPPTSGPCIGVIPLIGDHFAVRKIGITIFGNESNQIPIDNWGLDDLVVERVRAAAGPGVAVHRIAHAKGAFDSYRPGIPLFGDTDEKSAALVEQVAAQAHCERYVVVTRAISRYIGNQDISGVGIVNSGGPLLSRTAVFAVVWIIVHDGRSFQVLKREVGSTSGSNFLFGPPTRKLDDFAWPESPEAANSPVVREATRALVTEVFDKSMRDLLAR